MNDERRTARSGRGRVALLLAGVLIGILFLTPAGAHVGNTIRHLWRDHLRGKVDARIASQLDESLPMWAVVASNGALGANSGATSASRLALGNYEVVFGRNVASCAYQATVRDSALGAEILAEPRSNNANAVFVTTWSSAGAPADKPFQLAVFCV